LPGHARLCYTPRHCEDDAVFNLLLNPSLLLDPYVLGGVILMIVCVVHAVRTGNVFPWIYVIVFLPLIGCLVYIGMEIVPGLLRSNSARRAGAGFARAIDPNKDYRSALRSADLVGSVDSKRRLAEHYLQRGQYGEAVALYKDIAQGQFADDPVLLLGLAKAQLGGGDAAAAQATLEHLFAADPKFVSQDAHMIYARALEAQGKLQDAVEEYGRLVTYFAGEEARARYAAALGKLGRNDEARTIYAQIVKNIAGAPGRYRSEQRQWGEAAKAALRGA
jgi:hypothetical protein